MPEAVILLPGTVIDRLTIIKSVQKQSTYSRWEARCKCGKLTFIESNRLMPSYRRAHKISCGECNDYLKHPLTYRSYENMLKRCYNKNAVNYKDYGGRGIIVSEEWRKDFFNFLLDMGERPSLDHSIDRKDVNGNYEKSNCKWSTALEQRLNQRK